MSTVRRDYHPDIAWWVGQGVVGGIIAGLTFAVFETLAAIVMDGLAAIFMPIRMISSIVLGAGAMDPSFPLLTALVAGVLVHLVLSAIFGVIVGLIGFTMPALSHSRGVWLVSTSLFGLALWIVNFYVIAPIAGWTWFPNQTNPVIQAIAHTFFFGTPLGIYLDRALEAARGHEVDETDYPLPRAA
jgi:hypothetical protein